MNRVGPARDEGLNPGDAGRTPVREDAAARSGDDARGSRAPESPDVPGGAAAFLERAGPRTLVLASLALAAVVETATCILRFGAGLESQVHTAALATLTMGLRVHHGYVGALALVGALAARGLLRERRALRNALVVLGAGLLVSDLVHHFLVLWPVTGSPEFHLVYGP